MDDHNRAPPWPTSGCSTSPPRSRSCAGAGPGGINQVLIASRWPITVASDPTGLDPRNVSAFLSIKTGGLAMTGVRVPMWPKAADWYGAWERLVPRFSGDLLIGDLNIDPMR